MKKGTPFRPPLPRSLLAVGVGALLVIIVLLLNRDTCDNKPLKLSAHKSGDTFPLTFRNRKTEHVTANFPFKVKVIEMNITTTYTANGKEHEQNLFLMGSNTNPPFIATLAHPKLEAASADVYENDDMEVATRHLFEYLLNFECKKKKNGKIPLVVDAGSNLGYFGTYSAVMGCEVIAFEPQPRLIPIISTSAIVNGLTERFTLHNNIISDNADDKLKIVYDKSMCWGCSTVSKASPGDTSSDFVHIIDSTRIDAKVNRDVLLMKVDVEGFEVIAIESAAKVFDKYTVSNILVEWNPARWPHDIERGTKLLEKLYDDGYVIRHYDLRMGVPLEYCEKMEHLDDDKLTHRTWPIKRAFLGKMNENLVSRRGEANLWLSKR